MNRTYLYPKWLCALLLLLCTLDINAQRELEYWFDSYSSPQTIPIRISFGTISPSLNAKDLSQGFHTLYFRIREDDTYSPVSSSTFFKITGDGVSKIEYWFDDDLTKKGTMPIDVEKGEVQKLDLDLTNAAYFPLGFHKLNMRVASYGNQYSPVYSAYVMRLPEDPDPQLTYLQLTYWLDDDYQDGRNVISTNLWNGQGIYFTSDLNLSTASSGMHRLKFRITTNGFDDGVIYEYPILITRKYNNSTNVTIVSERHWFDDICVNPTMIRKPKSVITVGYDLDPAKFEIGQHAFHVQYKNSADVWSEQNVTYFYKDESGVLRAGLRSSEDATEIEDVSDEEQVYCAYNGEVIELDYQSPKLGPTGVVMLCDLSGKIIARQTVNSTNGLHASLSVEGRSKQVVIIKMISGDVYFYKKLLLN